MSPNRRRSGARPAIVLTLVVLVIAGLLYGGDRLTRSLVEDRVAVRVQIDLATVEQPAVNITGFPFLVQALSGSIDAAHVSADHLGATDERTLAVEHLDLELTGLSSNDRYRTITAARAEGTARISYPTLQTVAGVPVSYVGDGRIEITVNTQVLTADIQARVVGQPQLNVTDQTVTLGDPKVTVGDIEIPDFTAKALLTTMIKPFPVTGIPFGLKLSAITAGADGVDAVVMGTDVGIPG